MSVTGGWRVLLHPGSYARVRPDLPLPGDSGASRTVSTLSVNGGYPLRPLGPGHHESTPETPSPLRRSHGKSPGFPTSSLSGQVECPSVLW